MATIKFQGTPNTTYTFSSGSYVTDVNGFCTDSFADADIDPLIRSGVFIISYDGRATLSGQPGGYLPPATQ